MIPNLIPISLLDSGSQSQVCRLTRSLACGADRARTGDPRLAKPVLYQLSYSPKAPAASRALRSLVSLRRWRSPLCRRYALIRADGGR